MSEESDGHRYKNTKNILSEKTKSPLQNHARDEIFRGTTQVLFAYKDNCKECYPISQRTLIDVRNVHKTSTATYDLLFTIAAPVWKSMITLFLRELSAGDSLSLKKV